MGREFWHHEVIEVDLAVIAKQVKEFDEFYDSLIQVINKAKQMPIRPGWEFRYDLFGWHEFKFFSKNPSGLLGKPDMRLVYDCDRDYGNIYILAVGFRNAKETRKSKKQHSIYYVAVERLKRTSQDIWKEVI